MGEVGGRLEKVNVPGVGVATWKEACLKLFKFAHGRTGGNA